MKIINLKFARFFLLTGILGAASLSFILINAKPSLASNYSSQFYNRCKKSVPEPYHFVGILAVGILGGGYILKQQLKKKGNSLDDNDLSMSNNQNISCAKLEESYRIPSDFDLQVVDPTSLS